jgi:signal transduction histidine kinase
MGYSDLAIVGRAVQRLGGEAGVESEPGKGSAHLVHAPEGVSCSRADVPALSMKFLFESPLELPRTFSP